MRFGLLAAAALAGCAPRPPATVVAPSYVVGAPYQTEGVWVYPREQFRLVATGLATVADRAGRAADGEAWDGFVAAHATVQLPCLATVTNLDTGQGVVVRVIDRGPPGVHRLIGLSRDAGAAIGLAPGGVARVRMQVEDGPSQALRDGLSRAPALAVAAPRGEVMAESLPPPPGVAQSGRGRVARVSAGVVAVPIEASGVVAGPIGRGPAMPGELWIEAGRFDAERYATIQAGRLGLRPAIQRVGSGRDRSFRVRAGPYPDVAAADIALDRALRSGVTDARIVVE